VHRVLDPEMSAAEQQGLQRSADALKAALSSAQYQGIPAENSSKSWPRKGKLVVAN